MDNHFVCVMHVVKVFYFKAQQPVVAHLPELPFVFKTFHPCGGEHLFQFCHLHQIAGNSLGITVHLSPNKS